MKGFAWRSFFLVAFCLGLLLAWPAGHSGAQSKEDKKAHEGTPVLWREPADISTRDLFLGPGGEAMKPDLSRVTFEEDTTTGYSVKWDVRDGSGKKWVAKLGKEAQPETVSLRLVWAAGYMTEVSYLVPCAHIAGAPKPRKEVERCEGDGYVNVRFKSRPKGVKKIDNWSWDKNPFTGTREFQGLVVMMALLNNWDLKEGNNKTFYVPGADGGPGELQYVVTDLGGTFGKTGGPFTHTRNVPSDYVKTKFVTGVENGFVRFDYHGKNAGMLKVITVEQSRWIGGLLSRLSDKQIRDAFRAGGYSPEEVEMLAGAVRARINELLRL